MHKTTARFRECLNILPQPVQKRAERKFELLKGDSSHPSLHFKRIGKVWSVRIDRRYRALATADGDDFIWVWIGKHDEYEQMISQIST